MLAAGVLPYDSPEAVEHYRKAAEAGYAPAQTALAHCYSWGIGIPKDDAEALKWYRKAAEQGFAQAQNALGVIYADGIGVEKDEKLAIEWCRKSAEQGYDRAQRNYAYYLSKGIGAPKDEKEAARWYKASAEQGNTYAQVELGNCLLIGKGIEKNPQEALRLFHAAADQEYPRALYSLGWCYEYGKGVKRDHFEAAEWYRKAAARGHARSCSRLGAFCIHKADDDIYELDDAVPDERIDEGLNWLRMGVALGDPEAMNSLATSYEKGRRLPKNIRKAFALYLQAAEKGDKNAMFNLALCYQHGKSVPQDYAKACEWYRKAAEKNDVKSISNLAYKYLRGLGVPQDYGEAMKLIRKGMKLQYCRAFNYMGWCYENGWATPKNTEKAMKMYHNLAKVCYGPGLYDLGRCYFTGVGAEGVDDEKALFFWEQGDNMGNSKCSNSLGICFMKKGIVPEPSDEKAIAYFRKGEQKSQPACSYNMALCYEAGRGVPRDLRKAVQLYLTAAVNDFDYGASVLALRRLGVTPSDEEDAEHFRFTINHPENAHNAEEVPDLLLHAWEQDTMPQPEPGENWRAALPAPAEQEDDLAEEPLADPLPAQQAEIYLTEGKEAAARKDFARAIELYTKASELGNTAALNLLAFCAAWGEGMSMDEKEAEQRLQHSAKLQDAWAPLLLHALHMLKGCPCGDDTPDFKLEHP